MVRIGVVGIGFMGWAHFSGATRFTEQGKITGSKLKGGEVTTICTRSAEKLISRRVALGRGALGILAVAYGSGRQSRVWSAEPENGDLIARQATPYNAEPPLAKLVENWMTPVNSFFVRSHGRSPQLIRSNSR